MSRPRLNIVGSGRVARTLGRLLRQHGLVDIGAIHSRSARNRDEAVAFIGAGTSVARLEEMGAAPLWLIAVSDDAILPISERLAAISGQHWRGCCVFHCSGIHSSDSLAAVAAQGAATASLHPIHSFADPAKSVRGFRGTFCTLEGDEPAVAALAAMLDVLGAPHARLAPEHKALYHAATVVASNHLVALIATSLAMLETAGIPEQQARRMIAPLVSGSATNALEIGPRRALTGPVLRGDADSVRRHLDVIANQLPELLPSYRVMAQEALALTGEIGVALDPGHDLIRKLLSS
ncbi:MAG: DUF2520 domain-containing protein [Pseudomonas sp.]